MNFGFLLLLFICMPLIELYLLFKVHDWLGLGSTLALVIFTGALGASLAKMQGFQVMMDIRKDMAEGRMPAPRVVDGVMILIAGVTLITPGLITDALGFLLLTPPFRTFLKKILKKKFAEKIQQGTIDVSYRE